MQDRGDRSDRGGSRDGGGDDRSRDHQQPREGGGPDGGGSRPDTRFLQLEMSQVLYAEAEEVAKPALRELLLEAAKDRMRERFGAQIKALAELAVDELLIGVQASFDVESRIQRHQEERRSPEERLREVFTGRTSGGESPPAAAKKTRAAASRRRGRR